MAAAVAAAACLSFAGKAYSHNIDDRNKLSNYAAVSGKAIACREKLGNKTNRVISWIYMTFGGDSEMYAQIFAELQANTIEQQSSGTTNESCESVRKQLSRVVWPK